MSTINIDPTRVRSATSSFSGKVVLAETVSTAASAAFAIASPLAYLVSGLDSTLRSVQKNAIDIRNDCNSLVTAINRCCTEYENGEETVYHLFDGQGELYGEHADGGVWGTWAEDVGDAIHTTIDGFKSAVSDFWTEWGDLITEGVFAFIEISGDIAGIVATVALIANPVTGPIATTLLFASLAIKVVLTVNHLASRGTNLNALIAGYDNPKRNFLKEDIGDTAYSTLGWASLLLGLPGAYQVAYAAYSSTVTSVTSSSVSPALTAEAQKEIIKTARNQLVKDTAFKTAKSVTKKAAGITSKVENYINQTWSSTWHTANKSTANYAFGTGGSMGFR